MKSKLLPLLGLIILLSIVTFSLSGLKRSRASSLELTPYAYLPSILHQASPTVILTHTPSPSPTPTQTTTPQPGWLAYINSRRALGALPPLTETTAWSDGCWKHARYMVKNGLIQHSEDPSNPWYTSEGDATARASNLMVSSITSATDEYAIDLWLTGPFHGIGILDPALIQSGFGSYREAIGIWQMGACLDVIRGMGNIPPSVVFPIKWPENGSTMPYTIFSGTEWPDPLTSCPGYIAPTGAPVFLQLGPGNITPSVTDHSLLQGSTPVEHCEIDETNYVNPDSNAQSLGRSVLSARDAIVIVSWSPLVAGATYTVSITTNGQTYSWSFTVTNNPLAPILSTEAKIQ